MSCTTRKYNYHFFSFVFLLKYMKGGHISSQRGHGSGEHGSGLLSRWFSSHYHGGVHDEKAVARHTVNLLTSTIKADADQSDLRFCFRIISPTKNYTLQVPHYLSQCSLSKVLGPLVF
jgi:Arf-GAP with coiled-coil, ANK repeat and PH domain-containing protein